MKDCPKKQCLLSFLAVFAFMMAYEIFEHSVMLKQLYEASASALRSQVEMDQLTTWYMIHTAILAALFCCLYARFSDKSCGTMNGADKPSDPMKRGLWFGIMIGLIMGVLDSRSYTWMPIHMNLSMAWFFGALAEGVGIGLILAFTCRKPGECSTK
jgi:hypothetical protein